MREMDHTSDITKKIGENMKIVWNKKYTTIAVYAIIVLVCSALLALAAAYLPSVASSLGSVLSVVKPVIYGLVFAYILNPLNKVLEKRALKFLSKKKDHRKAQRVCAMVLTYLITLILIVLFVYAVVPQTARSVTDTEFEDSRQHSARRRVGERYIVFFQLFAFTSEQTGRCALRSDE